MKKKTKVVVYVLIALIVILLSWKYIPQLSKKDIIFDIKNERVEVKIGETLPLEYKISEDLDILWESEDEKVVTIKDGIISGISLGSTMIKGIVYKGDEAVVETCFVSTYYGDRTVALSDIIVPEGELFITKGDTYDLPISYDPINGYITSIKYGVLDSNIISFDGKVIAKEIGKTSLTITINKDIYKTIIVNVIETEIEPVFSKGIDEIIIEDNILLKPNETRKLEFFVEPSEAFIESVIWESNNPNIVEVLDGVLIAKSSGNTTVELLLNNNISKKINVSVVIPVKEIKLNSNPNLSMKIGDSSTIKYSISPLDATNKEVEYINSNPNIVSVTENGVIVANSPGSGTITVKSKDGDSRVTISYVVNARRGLINGTGNIWGYSSSRDQDPVRAGLSFFQNLASHGVGTISGNTYIYSNSKDTFKYNISSNILNINQRNILMRIYYPQNVDLSTTNTFTFFGGSGERQFGGYFVTIDNNLSIIKSSGIIILVSAKNTYYAQDGEYATEFVRNIVKQKSGVVNAIGGYSMSGPAAGEAAVNSMYSRLIIFDSYYKNTSSSSLKNKEITIYSPVGDSMFKRTLPNLNKMVGENYNNVTIVSNNKDVTDKFGNYYLIVNPGSKLGSGHVAVNITNANVFSYACR